MRIHISTTWDVENWEVIEDHFYEYHGPLLLADRSAQSQAGQAAKTASGVGAGYGSNAQSIGNQLVPTLTNDINNPTGYTPQQQNSMLVAGEQGAGGALSGVTGQAGLQAERTRNSGSQAGILDQAARRNAQTLSGNALGVANQSAELGQKKRESALGGLEGMYGTDVGAQLKAMGLIAPDVDAQVNAGKSGWYQNAMEGISTLGNLGLGSAKLAMGS